MATTMTDVMKEQTINVDEGDGTIIWQLLSKTYPKLVRLFADFQIVDTLLPKLENATSNPCAKRTLISKCPGVQQHPSIGQSGTH